MARTTPKTKTITLPKKGTPWYAWEVYQVEMAFIEGFGKLGKTQAQFAYEAGVCTYTVSRMMHNLWKEPRFTTILKIAKALGMKVVIE